MHTYCCCRCCCSVSLLLFLCLLYIDTVCSFTEYLHLIDINYYTVRCCKTYEYVFVYTCLLLCSVLLYSVLLLQLLLLFVIVCPMAKIVAVVHCI